ncbi:MAG: hypothetical protein ACLUCI_03270 [Blautia hansenii]
MADVKELKRDLENRLRNGESYSFDEIRKIMKNSGLSYLQIMQQTKKLNKEIKQAEEKALAEGKPFSREAYLSARMNG